MEAGKSLNYELSGSYTEGFYLENTEPESEDPVLALAQSGVGKLGNPSCWLFQSALLLMTEAIFFLKDYKITWTRIVLSCPRVAENQKITFGT